MTRDEVTVKLSATELADNFEEAAVELERFGPVHWFRAGSARYNDQILQLTGARGYRIAMASIAPIDTVLKSARLMGWYLGWAIEPGSVVVLHDVGERGLRTLATLELLLPKLYERGFSVMSLSALDALTQGREYSDDPQGGERSARCRG